MKRLFTLIAAAVTAGAALAQTHGEGGFYEWTPALLQASGYASTSNGTAVDGYKTSVTYGDEYATVTMGVNNATANSTYGGYQHRANINFANKKEAGIMQLTSAHPVVAFKVGAPTVRTASSEQKITDAYMELEVLYWDAENAKSATLGSVAGLTSSGRTRFIQFGGNATDDDGAQSVYLNASGNGSTSLTSNFPYEASNTAGTAYVLRLPSDSGEELAQFIYAIDLSDGMTDGALTLTALNLGAINIYADYTAADYVAPEYSLKWIKTFASIEELQSLMTADYAYGDSRTQLTTEEPDDEGEESEEQEEEQDEQEAEEEQPEVVRVHGENGYYAWTPELLQASGYASTSNGTAVDGYKTSVAYGDEYATVTMGVNNKDTQKYGGYQHRANINFANKTVDGIMQMTAEHPVVVFKVGAPTVRTASSEQAITDAYMELEVLYWDAENSKSATLGSVAGLTSSGRTRFIQFGGNATDDDGAQSVYLNASGNGSTSLTSNFPYEASNSAGTAYVYRLPSDSGEELAQFIYAIDLSDGMTDGALTLTALNLGAINIYADYTAEDYVAPEYSLKWIKTFTSIEEVQSLMSADYGWGDSLTKIEDAEDEPEAEPGDEEEEQEEEEEQPEVVRVHGEDGYYDWTPALMQESGYASLSNGAGLTDYVTSGVAYGDYVNVKMGVTTGTSKDASKGGYEHRTDFSFSARSSKETLMNVTSSYPVVAYKISIPTNDQATTEVALAKGYIQTEVLYNTYEDGAVSGNANKLTGIGMSNGRVIPLYFGGNRYDEDGVRIVGLNSSSATSVSYEGGRTESGAYTIYIKRLTSDEATAAGEKYTEYIVAMDLGAVTFTAADGTASSTLATADLALSAINFTVLGAYGDPTSSDYAQPEYYLKWIKTFASIDEVQSLMTADYGFGDSLTKIEATEDEPEAEPGDEEENADDDEDDDEDDQTGDDEGGNDDDTKDLDDEDQGNDDGDSKDSDDEDQGDENPEGEQEDTEDEQADDTEEEEEIPTGIIALAKSGNAVVYNMQGQRVSRATSGLYIVNGKMIMIK